MASDFAPLTTADLAELYAKPKRNKYGNRKVTFQGQTFDSKLEKDRYVFLLDAQARGLVTNLERQVEYRLEVNGQLIAKIIPDFRYHRTGHGTVVEDAKSDATVTPLFRVKAKLFRALYMKEIRIVKAATEPLA